MAGCAGFRVVPTNARAAALPACPRPDAGPDAPAVYLPLEEVPPAPSGLIAVLPWVAATRSRAAAPGPVHICGRLRQVPYLGLRPVPLPDWQGVVSARLKYPPIGATLVATPQID